MSMDLAAKMIEKDLKEKENLIPSSAEVTVFIINKKGSAHKEVQIWDKHQITGLIHRNINQWVDRMK